MCAQQSLRSAWASAQSDQSSLSAWRKLGSLATHWAHSEDFDQTGRMPRLIWVFAGGAHASFVTRWPIRHFVAGFACMNGDPDVWTVPWRKRVLNMWMGTPWVNGMVPPCVNGISTCEWVLHMWMGPPHVNGTSHQSCEQDLHPSTGPPQVNRILHYCTINSLQKV